MSINSKAQNIKKLFALSPRENELAFMFLGLSGVIVKTSNRTIIVDPADLLKGEEIKALEMEIIDLLLFTHNHRDHYSSKYALDILKAKCPPILAEPLVADDLKGKIPPHVFHKLKSAAAGRSYNYGHFIGVNVVKGIHRGPINLYHIEIEDLSVFHAGDSGYVPVKDYPSDLAFLPTGSPSPTASPQEAFNMTTDLKPSVVVTIHGSADQNKKFESIIKSTMPETAVIIPEPYTSNIVTLPRRPRTIE